MPEAVMEVGPISEARTHGIRVEVLSRYAPEHSKPQQSEWVFEYTVRITNFTEEPVQLISRHWFITDGFENLKEVEGPGVVGQQPVIAKGEAFQYSSWSRIQTPTGLMRGTYQMMSDSKGEFDIQIAPFALRSRYTIH
jgi:ApaG protein